MHTFPAQDSLTTPPAAADPAAAETGLERWLEAAAAADEARAQGLVDEPASRRILNAVFGNSPFLTQCAIKDPVVMCDLLTGDPQSVFDLVLETLQDNGKQTLNTDALSRTLRIAKRRAAMTIAVADITNQWALDQVVGAISGFADAALSAAARHVLREAAASGAFRLADPDDPAAGSGLIILGMGKLGARELNYSSDVDLIVLYDPERMDTDDPDRLQKNVVRLTRNLVRLMDERTADGYVFRTDLRLRPDPGATPLALSVMAAETYYESLGQNWERAAMIKARPVAGDLEAGQAFLKALTPFVWRKSLDFHAIQDIHSIKRQINARRTGNGDGLLGTNVKLGRGGIREIEFFAQTQQLIWGGREMTLRTPVTLEALDALVAFEQCDRQTADDLSAAYCYLRRIEHRLQMINDEQTQTLPDTEAGLANLATFLGHGSVEAFTAEMQAVLQLVQEHYAGLFADAPSLGADTEDGGSLVFTGVEADPDTLGTIAELGYANPGTVDAAIRGWHHGRIRATRSERSRQILTELVPDLLAAIARTPSPDQAFVRFDEFLSGLPAGVQLFSMFQANPQLLDLVAEIMGEAPRLARHLSSRPSVLDSVLAPGFFDVPPEAAELGAELGKLLARADHIEDVLNLVRRWAHDRRFQIGVQQLRGTVRPAEAAAHLSDIAEAAIAGLYPRVAAEFESTHGVLPGGSMAVIGLGKLGSRELTASSDLDLIFIYDRDDEETPSDGDKPLYPIHYYARLSQRLINALTALTPEGGLYEVDMRLRPSGRSGPIASAFDGFIKYQNEEAWTWEHMALTRARVVFGPEPLKGRIEAAIRDILARPREGDELLRDVAHMRVRMAEAKGAECPWSLKMVRGGIVDIEFMVQYLILRHGANLARDRCPSTLSALESLAETGALDTTIATELSDALQLWHGLQGFLALTLEDDITAATVEQFSPALKEDLVRIGGAVDFAELEAKIITTEQHIHALFRELIEDPAAALPPGPAEGAPSP